MKHTLFFILSLLLLSACNEPTTTIKYDRTKVSNELIGDEGYLALYDMLPGANTPEEQRIQAHLAYAEQLLRQRDISHLPVPKQANRERILNLLHEYMLAGDFPKNYDIAGERRPCFLDRDGNICAVGYLVEQTESLALACKINSVYKHDWISDMDMPELNDWIAASGLTKEEFSIIQPTYQYESQPLIASDNFAVPALVQLGAFGIVMTCINGKQIADGRTSNLAPILGISTGALNMGYSAYVLGNHGTPGAFFSALTGTSSLVTGSINLIFKKKLDKSAISLSSHAFLTPDRKYIPGICITYRL